MGRFNMYGHTACPKCSKPYRTMLAGRGDVVFCDDCGHEEPATHENSSRYSAASFASELEDDGDNHSVDKEDPDGPLRR